MKRLSLLLVSLLAVVACAPDIAPTVAPVTPVVITPTVTVTPAAVTVTPTPRPTPLPPPPVSVKPTPARTASPKPSPTPTTTSTTITPRPSPTPSPTLPKVAFIKASIANYGEMKYPGTANIDIPVGVLVTISLHDADAQALRVTNVPMSIEVAMSGEVLGQKNNTFVYKKTLTASSTAGIPPVHVIQLPFYPSDSGFYSGATRYGSGLYQTVATISIAVSGAGRFTTTAQNAIRLP